MDLRLRLPPPPQLPRIKGTVAAVDIGVRVEVLFVRVVRIKAAFFRPPPCLDIWQRGCNAVIAGATDVACADVASIAAASGVSAAKAVACADVASIAAASGVVANVPTVLVKRIVLRPRVVVNTVVDAVVLCRCGEANALLDIPLDITQPLLRQQVGSARDKDDLRGSGSDTAREVGTCKELGSGTRLHNVSRAKGARGRAEAEVRSIHLKIASQRYWAGRAGHTGRVRTRYSSVAFAVSPRSLTWRDRSSSLRMNSVTSRA